MKINMKTGIITIGNVVINMKEETITIDEEKITIEETPLIQTSLHDFDDVVLSKQQLVVNKRKKKGKTTLTAKQRKKFKKKRMNWIGKTITMPDDTTWKVESHVKGSHYVISREQTRGHKKGMLSHWRNVTTYTERKDASYSKAKGWRYWKDKGSNPVTPVEHTIVEHTIVDEDKERNTNQPPDYKCSICGLINTNKQTCQSVLSTDGTWLQQHAEYSSRKHYRHKKKVKKND
jgi:hypothetical protein|tara:strand:+ start:147 stop:845 length:699 start_codon:yes stop_codon:yes gene_type:complete